MSFPFGDDNFAPPCFAPRGFFLLCKGDGVGIAQDFSPAPRGGTGMDLDFLDPTRPAPPCIDKG